MKYAWYMHGFYLLQTGSLLVKQYCQQPTKYNQQIKMLTEFMNQSGFNVIKLNKYFFQFMNQYTKQMMIFYIFNNRSIIC